jgi:single-stranded DNA-specific DHH superfamily exonuclease
MTNLQPATEFIDEIDEDDKVLVLHHWDMDGTASAAIFSKILEKKRGRPADEISLPEGRCYHFTDEDRQKFDRCDKLVVLDFNVKASEIDKVPEEHGLSAVMIDHHGFNEEPSIDFVNPRKSQPDIYYPCSKIMLDIAGEFGLENGLRWIAGLGVIQDFGFDSCPELFEKLTEDYEEYLPENLTQENLAKKCEYGRYSSVLNIKPYKNSQKYAKLAYQAIMQSDDLVELEGQEEYREVYEVYLEMQDEFTEVISDYEEEREIDRDNMVVFFELDSDFHISSSVATNMSTKTPNWIHIVYQSNDGEINISARCQSGRVDLGEVMSSSLPEAAKENGAEAGGHKKAAGASFDEQFFQEFKERLSRKV